MKEIKLIYNGEDKRFYLYLGEDYIADTQVLNIAFATFGNFIIQ